MSFAGTIKRGLLATLNRNDLTMLAQIFGSDKYGSHYYTDHYDRLFRPIKRKKLNILEIGVGGYSSPNDGGSSLKMWKAYFRRSRIVGIDICDKTRLAERRIDIRKMDQTDKAALTMLSDEYGGFDIVVDDGSHRNDHTIETFQTLFPLMRPNGIYVVEDVQTSYWPSWGGGLNKAGTMIEFFKGLADGLNYIEVPRTGYLPNYLETHIIEVSFLHNLIVVRNGHNDDPCNIPRLRDAEIVQM